MSTLLRKHNFDLVFDSQKVFRLVLEAISNPLKVVNIKPYSEKLYSEFPEFLVMALTLLDNEVNFHVCFNNDLSQEISSLTSSKSVGIQYADFVFVTACDKLKDIVDKLKCGTIENPHKSATLIIADNNDGFITKTFYGPGIDGKINLEVSIILENAVKLRDAQNYEYAQGIDLLFISKDNNLVFIPRLVKMEDS